MSPAQVANFQVAVQLGVLVTLGLVTLISFLALVRAKEPIEFQGHWGGFGGALGGWRISRSLGLLMATLIFGGMFAIVGGYSLSTLGKKDAEKPGDKEPKCPVPAIVVPTPCTHAAVVAPSQTPKLDSNAEKSSSETPASVQPRVKEGGQKDDEVARHRRKLIIPRNQADNNPTSTIKPCPPCSSEAAGRKQ